jgi:hypothetical protein
MRAYKAAIPATACQSNKTTLSSAIRAAVLAANGPTYNKSTDIHAVIGTEPVSDDVSSHAAGGDQ